MGGIENNFSSDPFAGQGYWGRQTSQVNFCEEDYTVTYYVAEFVNSLTNLAYVYAALTTLPAHTPIYRSPSNLALLAVGVASVIFHATLKHTTQLADDLSMFAVCGAIVCQLYTPGWSGRGKAVFGTAVAGALSAVGYVHATGDSVALHTITFGVLVGAIGARSWWEIRQRYGRGRAKERAEVMWTFRRGAVCFVVGFGLWVLDGKICFRLREMRAMLGLPWAWFLELHGWWHILTSIGAASFVELGHLLTKPDVTMNGTHKATMNGAQHKATMNGTQHKATMNGTQHKATMNGTKEAVMNGKKKR